MVIECHCTIRRRNAVLVPQWEAVDTFQSILPRYSGCDWNSIRYWDTADRNATLRDAVKGAKQWVQNLYDGVMTNYFVYGNPGSGKTLIKYLMRVYCPLPSIWVNVPQLTQDIAHFWSTRDLELTEWMDLMATVPVLFLDDIGKAGLEKTEGMQSHLYTIVNARWNALLPTVASSNLTEPEIRSRLGAIASRLMERDPGVKTVFPVAVGDYREKGA